MAFKMKGSHHYGKNPLKQKKKHPMEAIKEVDTKSTGYSNQDKSKMKTEKAKYLAKLKGDYIDLRGKNQEETIKILEGHGLTEPEWYKEDDNPGVPKKDKTDAPTKQTKSGKGNIFTKKGRIQRLVNKHYETPKGKKRQKLAKKLGKQGVFGYGDVFEYGFYHGGEDKDRGYYKDTGVKKFVPNLKSHDANLLDEITPRKKTKK